jgi:hypothetical protein
MVRLCMEDSAMLAKIGLPQQAEFRTVDDSGQDGVAYEWTWATLDQCEQYLDSNVMKEVRASFSLSEWRIKTVTPNERLEEVMSILAKCHISTSSWSGQGRTRKLRDLVTELERGECTLQCDELSLWRVVRIILLRVWAPGDQRLLLQVGSSECEDGEFYVENKLPGGRLLPHESPLEAATRIMEEYLQIEEDDLDLPSAYSCEYKEVMQDTSTSFPGLPSKFQQFSMDIRLNNEEELVTRLGLGRRSRARTKN